MRSPLHELLDEPDFAQGVAWRRVGYRPREAIVREGEQAKDVFLILSGTVEVTGTVELDDQRRVHPGFCELHAGDVFGELCLFDDEPRSASVVAITECELAIVDGQSLLGYLDRHPARGYFILRHIVQTLVERLRTSNRRFLSVFSWGLKAHQIDRHL
jgi:CRP-like cAMP-binding protein